MTLIVSRLDVRSGDFKASAQAMGLLVEDLRAKLSQVDG